MLSTISDISMASTRFDELLRALASGGVEFVLVSDLKERKSMRLSQVFQVAVFRGAPLKTHRIKTSGRAIGSAQKSG